jgi:DNA-binding NarL/FixJ family response regulator
MSPGVLIVDDDEAFRSLVRRMLGDAGLVVVGEVGTVAAALAAIDALQPSAVLLDIGLPDGDGVALAARLATLPSRLAVVLTSTDYDAVTAADVRRCGARGFVPKAELPGTAFDALRADG